MDMLDFAVLDYNCTASCLFPSMRGREGGEGGREIGRGIERGRERSKCEVGGKRRASDRKRQEKEAQQNRIKHGCERRV